ncbi:hypothetical protein KFE25_005124 [Diacronema lutheri]|uniref:Major facilitator superfamily (MFS) profile domain-containing protein n=2 Tax=Diacronema lutheri TaxID=2081491 RepID=A0A8J5XBX6_DIALT|nr:hypothetical protein KFE25_005124 [Diacronema lutheri]
MASRSAPTIPRHWGGIPATLSVASIASSLHVPMSHSYTTEEATADFGSVMKAVLVSAASSVLSGYDQGVIAAAMLTMKPALGLSSLEQEVSIGVLNVTAAVGGVMAGYYAEWHGRKRAIALANLLFLVGSFIIAGATGFWTLFAGRVLQGAAVGFALVVAPIFTAELVPAKQRGMLVSLSDVSTNFGILLGYSAGLVFLETPSGWRWMFAVGALPAFLLMLLIWAVPESPRWLVGVGRHVSARRALNELYTDSLAADRHFDEMRRMADEHAESEHSGSWRQVFWHEDAVLRRMIWRGLAIAFLSQAIGTEAVVYYAPEVVRAAGVGTDRQTLLAIMGIGLCKLAFLLIASQLFDRLGRRPMLLASAAGLLGALFVLAAASRPSSRDAGAALAIGGLCAFMAAFSLGFSPLTYVICSELFPSDVRARAMSLALFTTRIVAGVISSSFVSLREALGPANAWLLFAPVAALAFVFVLVAIPETKGHSLEEIADVFRRKQRAPRARPREAAPRAPGGARPAQPSGRSAGAAAPQPSPAIVVALPSSADPACMQAVGAPDGTGSAADSPSCAESVVSRARAESVGLLPGRSADPAATAADPAED